MSDIILPTLHKGQVEAFMLPARFRAIRCGRRWGKTDFCKTIIADAVIKGKNAGWFTPTYKILSEAFVEIEQIISPLKKQSSKNDGVFRAITGGRVDFWTLENDRAGRSRKYHVVVIDEAAFSKNNMMEIWERSIKPSLLDYSGMAIVASTPNGSTPDNFFYQICNDKKYGFKEYHAPTHTNPYLNKVELDKLIIENDPEVYRQEYLAEFVDWQGRAFFNLSSMLENELPVIPQIGPVGVFAVLDTAIKDGSEHDGTAISFWSYSPTHGNNLVLLDWDIVSIEGSLLEAWIPRVYQRLEELSSELCAVRGSLGIFIEDKGSGTILLQQAARRGFNATAIDSKLTAAGKDQRAISVSGYVYRGMVKISKYAHDKVIKFHGNTRNHFIHQICGYRIGQKDGEDDLFDTFCYAISLTLGNSEGY